MDFQDIKGGTVVVGGVVIIISAVVETVASAIMMAGAVTVVIVIICDGSVATSVKDTAIAVTDVVAGGSINSVCISADTNNGTDIPATVAKNKICD
ncbi:Hypothetical predicted protein [Octopus vulgaris]|uniref:Uncharacterized protein n=1 Tax=Octopus vulgaris TaxID=6645 RepID=A0AA36AZ25_OCTVU|nr:Hypothetical predicted protein [Octopus vulgaris]